MSLVQIIAFFGITFFFLWMFEKIYAIYNVPQKLFQLLKIRPTFLVNLVIIVIFALVIELLVTASGTMFEIKQLQINLLRLLLLAFMFSFYNAEK